jgi:ribose transport system ATP-binding protein
LLEVDGLAEVGTLEVRGIRKEYPGTLALDDVSAFFEGGRVHALLGKNGAGKSTLVKIIAGTETPTRGAILVNGKPVSLRTATDAFKEGIATVYQELSLVPGLTVAENILLGRLPKRGPLIDWRAVFRRADDVLRGMGVSIDVRKTVGELCVAQQQVVEIAKAMSANPSVLMLDEPTSALAQHETDMLFGLVRGLAQRGVSIIYITHRLHELKLIADTLTVLRDGVLIGRAEMADTSAEQIVHMMFGEIVKRGKLAEEAIDAPPALEVQRLTKQGQFRDVSFAVRQGEILGIAGMLGSGRTELLKAIFGAEQADSGEVILGDKAVRPSSPAQMKDFGVAMTPENRKAEGLVQILSTRTNMCLASLDRIAVKGFISPASERSVVNRFVQSLQIKLSDTESAVSSLSGGNQQKVVVGKWLNTQPKVMLFDEPTRGIDVQAKQQIFEIMWALSAEGIASVIVSSELEELIDVCHRILIMRHGSIVDEVSPQGLTADDLIVRCMED